MLFDCLVERRAAGFAELADFKPAPAVPQITSDDRQLFTTKTEQKTGICTDEAIDRAAQLRRWATVSLPLKQRALSGMRGMSAAHVPAIRLRPVDTTAAEVYTVHSNRCISGTMN